MIAFPIFVIYTHSQVFDTHIHSSEVQNALVHCLRYSAGYMRSNVKTWLA